MKTRYISSLTDINQGDQLVISNGKELEAFKAEMVKVSESDGTEIILSLKENKYFNLGMYLKGKSWVKDVMKIEL